jgi:hypothetical protein
MDNIALVLWRFHGRRQNCLLQPRAFSSPLAPTCLRTERDAHASICAKNHIAHLAFAMQVAMVHRDSLLLSRRHASISSSAKA